MSIRFIESPWGVRWTSLATLAAIVLVVAVVRRRPLLGGAAAMGWLIAFEIPYEAADMLVHRLWDAHRTAWAFWLVTVSAWPLLAHRMGVRPHARWVAGAAILFGVWIATGFGHNDAGQQGPVLIVPELLNVGSKTALGVAYALGAAWPERSGWGQILVFRHGLRRIAAQRLHGEGQVTR